LWKSDGTEAGTVLVRDINPSGTLPFGPSSLTNFTGTLYLTADDGMNGRELWKSDGTAAGTVLVKDIRPGGMFTDSILVNMPLTNVDGTLYFAALDGVNGRELWKSDGTAAGTVMVKDIHAGSDYSDPESLTNVNGTLYFVANDGVHGPELWKSDGTVGGTILVKDTNPDTRDFGLPWTLTNVNDTLFFTAFDEMVTPRLWKSDGTAEGTVRVPDAPLPGPLTASNGSLFFVSRLGLWRLSQFVGDDAARTPENTPVTINVGANDFLGAGAAITSTTPAAHGSAVLAADGSFTYTPAADFSGVDSFTYTVTNRFGDIDTATVTVSVIQPVEIDIKPGDTTNAINLNNDGTIPVFLFGSAAFDVSMVDVASIRLAGASVSKFTIEDVNRDGRLDLKLHFRIDATNLQEVYAQLLLADAADGTLDSTRKSTSLLLTGRTTDGRLWEGSAAVTLFMTGNELDDLLVALGLR